MDDIAVTVVNRSGLESSPHRRVLRRILSEAPGAVAAVSPNRSFVSGNIRITESGVLIDGQKVMALEQLIVRIPRDTIDEVVLPGHLSVPGAVAGTVVGLAFGHAWAATSNLSHAGAAAVRVGLPVALGSEWAYLLRENTRVIYRRRR